MGQIWVKAREKQIFRRKMYNVKRKMYKMYVSFIFPNLYKTNFKSDRKY